MKHLVLLFGLLLLGCAPSLDVHRVGLAPSAGSKVLVVNVWMVECPVCEGERDELARFYDDYHARGVDVVGLTDCVRAGTHIVDERACRIAAARRPFAVSRFDRAGLRYLHAHGLSVIWESAHGKSWPYLVAPGNVKAKSVVLDASGRIVGTVDEPGSYADFEAAVKAYL